MIERLRSAITRSPKRANQVSLLVGALLLVAYFLLPVSFQPWIALGLGVIILLQAALIRGTFLPSSTGRGFSVRQDASIQDLHETLAELATRIHVTVDGLVRASDAITEVTAQQISGTTEQVEVINTTSTLLENFLKLTDQVNNQAETMTQTAEQAAGVSQNGQDAIQHVIDSMDDIRTQVAVIGETIVRLATLTHRIDEIITSVSEIATQSNLLALNASIEAARAGVHGRGFSVVANEVRSLSQQSTQAATQVRAILVEIQAAVKETIQAAEIGMQRVAAGVEVTQEVNDILVKITDDVRASHDAVQAIYHAVRHQTEGMEEIAAVINRIDWITEQNMTSTVMGETVSTNLNRLAAELKKAVQESETLEQSVMQHTHNNSNGDS